MEYGERFYGDYADMGPEDEGDMGDIGDMGPEDEADMGDRLADVLVEPEIINFEDDAVTRLVERYRNEASGEVDLGPDPWRRRNGVEEFLEPSDELDLGPWPLSDDEPKDSPQSDRNWQPWNPKAALDFIIDVDETVVTSQPVFRTSQESGIAYSTNLTPDKQAKLYGLQPREYLAFAFNLSKLSDKGIHDEVHNQLAMFTAMGRNVKFTPEIDDNGNIVPGGLAVIVSQSKS
jgi:hypothetical protein